MLTKRAIIHKFSQHADSEKSALSKLNESHRLALKYLESKRPEFVSPTEIGREVGDQLGMEGWGSAFGLPLCNKLVDVGLAVQNNEGHFAAATK